MYVLCRNERVMQMKHCIIIIFCVTISACYGIEQRENGIEELINEDWLCDKCTFLQSLSENEYSGLYRSTACCLCAMHGGAMKPTTCGQWCHIVCAIACPEVRFVDKTKRGPIDIRLLNPARRKLVVLKLGFGFVLLFCDIDSCFIL